MRAPNDGDRETRNAAVRSEVESLLEQLQRQTEQLALARQEAAELTVRGMSPDELAWVEVDSAGTLLDLRLAYSAFERTTPAALARSIAALVRATSARARDEAAELLRPFTEQGPDVRGLADLVPEIGELAEVLRSAGDPGSGRIR